MWSNPDAQFLCFGTMRFAFSPIFLSTLAFSPAYIINTCNDGQMGVELHFSNAKRSGGPNSCSSSLANRVSCDSTEHISRRSKSRFSTGSSSNRRWSIRNADVGGAPTYLGAREINGVSSQLARPWLEPSESGQTKRRFHFPPKKYKWPLRFKHGFI